MLQPTHTRADGVKAAVVRFFLPLAWIMVPVRSNQVGCVHTKAPAYARNLFQVPFHSGSLHRQRDPFSQMVEGGFEPTFATASSPISLRMGSDGKFGTHGPHPGSGEVGVSILPKRCGDRSPVRYLHRMQDVVTRPAHSMYGHKGTLFRMPHTGWMSGPIPLCVKCSKTVDTAKQVPRADRIEEKHEERIARGR